MGEIVNLAWIRPKSKIWTKFIEFTSQKYANDEQNTNPNNKLIKEIIIRDERMVHYQSASFPANFKVPTSRLLISSAAKLFALKTDISVASAKFITARSSQIFSLNNLWHNFWEYKVS